MTAPLCYNYPGMPCQTAHPQVAREYLDYGVDTFVFSDPDHGPHRRPRAPFIPEMLHRRMGVKFVATHSPFGSTYDLNIQKRTPPVML